MNKFRKISLKLIVFKYCCNAELENNTTKKLRFATTLIPLYSTLDCWHIMLDINNQKSLTTTYEPL